MPLMIAALLAYVLMPAVTLLTARTKLGRRTAVALVYLLFLAILIAVLVAFVPVVVNQAKRLSLELQSARMQLERASTGRVVFLGMDLPLDEFLDEYDAVSSQVLRPERVADPPGSRSLPVRRSTAPPRDQGCLAGISARSTAGDAVGGCSDGPGFSRRRSTRRSRARSAGRSIGSDPFTRPDDGDGSGSHRRLVRGLDLSADVQCWFTVVVVLVYSSVQLVENVWLQPRTMGRTVRLNPGLVFVAVVGALALGGALIALIIVPLLGSAGVLGHLHQRRLQFLLSHPSSRRARPSRRAYKAA